MKPACPTQFPACLMCNQLVGLCLWLVCNLFPACPAEMLPTLRLKTGTFPILMGSDQVRLVMTGSFPFKNNQLVRPAYLVLKQDRRGSVLTQDGHSVGQDGKCNRQAIEIHDRTVSRWVEPQFRCRVMEGR